MRVRFLAGLAIPVLAWATPIFASDQPLYQPAPQWVVASQLPQNLLTGAGTPGPYFDLQERFEDEQEWSYVDLATRINSPSDLAQSNVIAIPWSPDKGDFIVHKITIIRGNEKIDVVAKGQRFTILRREESLEQRELTGILTATLAVEGLQVGDVLQVQVSVTKKDPALAGRMQWSIPVISLPMKVSGAVMRLTWPQSAPLKWKILGQQVASQSTRSGGYETVTIALPAPKRAEMPEDAPLRFQNPPILEVSSFSDWRDVSKVMAPLYEGANLIPPGSPLAAEVARIMTAEADPARRAALALRSVQDNIRYLAIGMDGGNYVPQSPEKTWSARFGDCKAKTLLLLAMLRSMNIDAEPVLANVGFDDLVPDSPPSAAAFNHIFVHARIGGTSYWLDGTGSGTRFADLGNSPPLHNVLPLRKDGAVLEYVPWHPPARPTTDVDLAIDESSSVDLPSVIDAKLTLHGPQADYLNAAAAQMQPKERRDFLAQILTAHLGEGQVDEVTLVNDADAGTVTIKGRVVTHTAWKFEDRRAKRSLSFLGDAFKFAPDRSRAAWSAIPVLADAPDRVQYKVHLMLPEQGRGITMEGSAGPLVAKAAGHSLERKVTIANGAVDLDETLTSDGSEIPASSIPAERTNFARLQGQLPRLIAPVDARRKWSLGERVPAGGSQGQAIEQVYAASIADAEADDTSALTSRASYHLGVNDYQAALGDYKLLIAKEPSVENYVAHGGLALALGDVSTAVADGEAALKIDSSSSSAIGLVAEAEAQRGNVARGSALFDERIAIGGEEKPALVRAKAELIGTYGNPREAIKLLNGLDAEKPGDPLILNAMCWIRATRNFELDVALKNCTSGIELSANTAPILDSRALVWFRMGRYDEALRDIDAVLLQVPGLGPSHFLRGFILQKLGRSNEAQTEFALGVRLDPAVERVYARYGLKP